MTNLSEMGWLGWGSSTGRTDAALSRESYCSGTLNFRVGGAPNLVAASELFTLGKE
jgi:hypothetical protein